MQFVSKINAFGGSQNGTFENSFAAVQLARSSSPKIPVYKKSVIVNKEASKIQAFHI